MQTDKGAIVMTVGADNKVEPRPVKTGRWSGTDLTLLDREPSVSAETAAGYAASGWQVRTQVADVFDWSVDLADPPGQGGPPARWDLVVCTLFLHHLDSPRLRALLRVMAQCCDWFFACEPRRAHVGWPCSHDDRL